MRRPTGVSRREIHARRGKYSPFPELGNKAVTKTATSVAPATKVHFVGIKLLANGRGRWLALVASLVVSAGIVYAQGTKPPCCVAPPAGTSVAPSPPPSAALHTASPAEAGAPAA